MDVQIWKQHRVCSVMRPDAQSKMLWPGMVLSCKTGQPWLGFDDAFDPDVEEICDLAVCRPVQTLFKRVKAKCKIEQTGMQEMEVDLQQVESSSIMARLGLTAAQTAHVGIGGGHALETCSGLRLSLRGISALCSEANLTSQLRSKFQPGGKYQKHFSRSTKGLGHLAKRFGGFEVFVVDRVLLAKEVQLMGNYSRNQNVTASAGAAGPDASAVGSLDASAAANTAQESFAFSVGRRNDGGWVPWAVKLYKVVYSRTLVEQISEGGYELQADVSHYNHVAAGEEDALTFQDEQELQPEED